MAKKKKTKKKLYRPGRSASSQSAAVTSQGNAASVSSAAQIATATQSAVSKKAAAGQPSATAPSRGRWAYVGKDLHRIGFLVWLCVLLELVIWFLLQYTGVGPTVYRIIGV